MSGKLRQIILFHVNTVAAEHKKKSVKSSGITKFIKNFRQIVSDFFVKGRVGLVQKLVKIESRNLR